MTSSHSKLRKKKEKHTSHFYLQGVLNTLANYHTIFMEVQKNTIPTAHEGDKTTFISLGGGHTT